MDHLPEVIVDKGMCAEKVVYSQLSTKHSPVLCGTSLFSAAKTRENKKHTHI